MLGVTRACRHDGQSWNAHEAVKAAKAGTALEFCFHLAAKFEANVPLFKGSIWMSGLGIQSVVGDAAQDVHQEAHVSAETGGIMLSGGVRDLQCMCI